MFRPDLTESGHSILSLHNLHSLIRWLLDSKPYGRFTRIHPFAPYTQEETDLKLLRHKLPHVSSGLKSACNVDSLLDSPLLFVITFITAIFFIMGDAPASEDYRLEFSAVTGYFIQDDPATNPNGFDVYVSA